jgi:hypothetical protein
MNRLPLICIILAFLFASSDGLAQDLMQKLTSRRVGSDGGAIEATFAATPAADVHNQNTTFSAQRFTLSGIVPFYNSNINEVGLGAFITQGKAESAAILPTTLDPMPEDYTKISVGPYYKHIFKNKWMFALNVQIGSSSDEPFSGINVMDIGGNVVLNIPAGKKSSWVAFINYSSNRDFWRNIPIPGFGYAFDAEWARGMAGAPTFYLHILHKKPINFIVRYFPIITTYAEMGYDISPPLRIATCFAWHDDHFWRKDRQVERDQMFFVRKEIGGYVSIRPEKFLTLKFTGGVGFDRYIFEAQSVIRDKGYNRVDLDSSPFVNVSLSATIGGPK